MVPLRADGRPRERASPINEQLSPPFEHGDERLWPFVAPLSAWLAIAAIGHGRRGTGQTQVSNTGERSLARKECVNMDRAGRNGHDRGASPSSRGMDLVGAAECDRRA